MKILIPSLIFLIFFFPLASSITCLTSSEDYASEAVIPEYSLFNLRKIVDSKNGESIFQSQYDSRLITIAKETNFPPGLSVRIQLPTKLTEVKTPHIKFISTSARGDFKTTGISAFGSWRVECIDSVCVFEKENQRIEVREIGLEKEVIVEIRDDLSECSGTCSGTCIQTFSEEKCIDSRTRNDINTLLRYFSISNDFEELLESYRIIGSQEITFYDIKPEVNPFINWQEAMRQELVFLNSKGVIDLQRNDIESISLLSKRGQAGQNYRIVNERNEWIYYDDTEDPIIISQRDCKEYSSNVQQNSLITGNIAGVTKNPFYLIPLVIFAIGFFSLIILIIIARAINSYRERRSIQITETSN